MKKEEEEKQQYRIHCCCHHNFVCIRESDTYHYDDDYYIKIVKAIDERFFLSVLFCFIFYFFFFIAFLHWNWKFNGGLLVPTTTCVCCACAVLCVSCGTHKYSCTVCSSLLEYSCWLSICKHIFIVHCNSKISQLHIILRIHWKSPHISEEEEERNKKQSTNICKSAYGRWRTMMNWWLLLFYQIIYRSSFLRRVSCFSSNFLESHSQRNKNEEKKRNWKFFCPYVGRSRWWWCCCCWFFFLHCQQ